MASPESISNHIFISHSHQDAKWAQRLRVHLKPLERTLGIASLSEAQYNLIKSWPEALLESIRTSQVAIILVSAYYLASDYHMEQEMPAILQAAEGQELRVVTLIISSSFWTRLRRFSKIPSFNSPDTPLSEMTESQQDTIFAQLVQLIEQELDVTTQRNTDPVVLEHVEIRNFKNITELNLDFTVPSSLRGDWVCIAGINGSGKTSILQAVCLLLLGEDLILELGGTRLQDLRRRTPNTRLNAELYAVVRANGESHSLHLPLNDSGLNQPKLWGHPEYARMTSIWNRLRQQTLVSFGSTRNLSTYKDTRFDHLSPHVQRQMTLFDPFTQIASVDVLLEGGERYAAAQRTLHRLLQMVLSPDVLNMPDPGDTGKLRFHQGAVHVGAVDLPDGFRSTVAWLAQLCTTWHETAPAEVTETSDPAQMTGIVLLDELELHLHPSLQRTLVPRLRKALPKVQFIVTTHSPLILSSFDQAELVVLDRTEETGVRSLDRQIFGFSTDQVCEWLMNTPAQSPVLEEKLASGDDANLASYLYQSEHIDEQEAANRVEQMDTFLKNLRQNP